MADRIEAAGACDDDVLDHPLNPLSADEIREARGIAQRELDLRASAKFAMIRLDEPAKSIVRSFRAGDAIDRSAFVVVIDRIAGTLHDGVVSITAGRVTKWTARPGLQAALLMEDLIVAERVIRANQSWQDAVRRRGIDDLDKVRVDPWMVGNFGVPEEQGRRVVASLSYYVENPGDTPYARPIEGVVAYVDLGAEAVIRVVDLEAPVPIPDDPGRYDAASVGPLRQGLRPLDVIQPEGPSFSVHGHEIRWQRWRFRFSFNGREGLVLHTVGYEDGDEVRPILYRAALSEMIVPYGDVSPSHFFQHAFDLGDFGVGKGVNSLALGCDCLGEIHYFDAVLHDDDGEPVTVRNAVCLHEEDASILWKHWDFPAGDTEVRRSRRLVISAICTNLNYEYGYYWYFYQDGTIEYDVKLTGILQTAAIEPGSEPAHATMIAPGLSAPHHQHLFNVRLDAEIDGVDNTVSEVDLVAAEIGPANPYGSAMVTQSTSLTCESEARRVVDPAAGRTWVISSGHRRNHVGKPTAYRLRPMYTPTILAPPESAIGIRGGFARYNVWVTAFDAEQRHAGGEYPNQHSGGAGLPEWSTADRPIENTDIVVWHTFGISHVARPEDWPVMPVEHAGFLLVPWGFFPRNPALDVPPAHHHC
ncbi:MAG: primary-amine oxidase [Jatrophihabitantaceae bacterium]